MAVPLTALGRVGRDPVIPSCRACGSTRDASRGFPGDVHYCKDHVPPELRGTSHLGLAPPPPSRPPATAGVGAAAADLFAGLAPA